MELEDMNQRTPLKNKEYMYDKGKNCAASVHPSIPEAQGENGGAWKGM